ncbi:MAG TPA: hypothetical protein VIY51_25160 [Xanthobacteraceae bacterium]
MPVRASTGLIFVLMALVATLSGVGGAVAQLKVRTETIRPPAAAITPPTANQFVPPAADGKANAHPGEPQAANQAATQAVAGAAAAATPKGAGAEAGLTLLPPAVLRTRERILATARTGDLQKLVALMQAGGDMPAFTHTQKQDPTAYWKEIYPDSDGVEILSILITILETEPARTEAGTPQEMYVWPYFARLPIRSLTPAQKVELFQVVTGADYKGMLERGRYLFYQVGIGPDGAWRYFLSSDQ